MGTKRKGEGAREGVAVTQAQRAAARSKDGGARQGAGVASGVADIKIDPRQLPRAD